MEDLPCGAITKNTKDHKGTQRRLRWGGPCVRKAHVRPAPCVVLSRGRFGASRLHGDSRAAFGLIAAKGGGPGFNLCGSSKPPSLQTSKLPLCVLPAVAGP